MAKLKLHGKNLRAIGYPEGPVISIAMNIMEKNYKFEKEEDVMNLLKKILAAPVEYAGDAVLGLIAQQLTANGYIVKGKGEVASLSSAAHGAGRKMSRSAAIKSITPERLKATLQQYGVKLMGGGLDEAPQAYKDIEEVMRSQQQLVDVVGVFTPKIVRMDG